MRLPLAMLTVCLALGTAACAGNEAKVSEGTNQNAAANAGKRAAPAGANAPGAPGAPSVASSHGAPPPAGSPGQEHTAVDTAEEDAKIKAALKKAKGAKASAADKRAAASAYLERANVYWSAQNPFLYKYALADYRSVLVYDPGNAEAKERVDYLVKIYNDMGRPVPQLSNEK